MTTFQLLAMVLVVTSAAAYLNARLWRLPSSVALMATAAIATLALLALEAAGIVTLSDDVRDLVARLDLGDVLLHGLLGLLLFAGALHVDVAQLGAERVPVALLALGGTLISTALVGGASFAIARATGYPLPWLDALLFGALIAPTDPIAVLGMLKVAGAPPRLGVRIAGESLFNDGVGVVVFTVLISIGAGHEASWSSVLGLFLRQAVGGAAFGLVTGYAVLRLIRTIDDYSVEVLLTLTLVIAGYVSAELLGLSAPIGAVVAGLAVGSRSASAMSEKSRSHVDLFWHLIDEILNAVLFVMIGLVVVLVPFSNRVLLLAVLAIPVTLAARFVSVAMVTNLSPSLRRSIPHSITVLTWGGLRGGLSIAMALELQAGDARDVILVMTYAVVAFSILVQGSTFGRLLRALGIGDTGAISSK